MSQSQILYRLQRTDLELDNRRARVREITSALEDQGAVVQAKAEVTRLQGELRARESRATNLNLELKSVATQFSELNARLYGGKGGSPKELQDIEHKIEELKRRQSDLESELLETMFQMEEQQSALTDASGRLAAVESTRASDTDKLNGELSRLKKEIKSLKVERETVDGQINEQNRTLYQQLRATKQGHAIVLLKGEMCSYCRVDQTSNIVQQVRQGRELVSCQSCGRILVAL